MEKEIDNISIDEYYKIPLDACLYVRFDGDRYDILHRGEAHYEIGEMLCEMGNVKIADIKPILMKCEGFLSEYADMDLLNAMLNIEDNLIAEFGVVAGSVISSELINVVSEFRKNKDNYDETIKTYEEKQGNSGIKEFVFEDTGFDDFGDKYLGQYLLTAFVFAASSLSLFKMMYQNYMESLFGNIDEENKFKILEIFGPLVGTQHIDYKIMLIDNEFANVYGIQTALSLLAFEFVNVLHHNKEFAKCKNCGRYFVLTGRSDTVYCPYPAPTKQGKTCREIGAQITRSNKEKNDKATAAYRKLYMKLKMHVRRHPEDKKIDILLEKLVTEGKKWRDDLNSGAAETKDFIKWLKSIEEIATK